MFNIDFSKISKKEWVLICVFIILAILSLSYNFIFAPLVREIRQLSLQLEQKKRNIQRSEVNPQLLKELEAEVGQLKGQIDYYQQNMCGLTDVPQILKGLNQIAERLEITFVSVNPLERQKLPLPGVAGDYFELIPINIKLKCGYHQLGIFINRIEALAQLMKITQLEINVDSRDIWNHQVELVITTFALCSQKDQESES